MPNKKGTWPKLPQSKRPGVVLRSVGISQGIKDVVVATETPVRRYDEERGYVINEVLLMDGVVLRAEQARMPIVDSHDDTTAPSHTGQIQRPSFASVEVCDRLTQAQRGVQ